MEEKIQALIALIRSEDDDVIEEGKNGLLILAEEVGVHAVFNHLESVKRSEVLLVQWEIEEVMDLLVPPKVEEKKDNQDDPTKRALRLSELELKVQHPSGIALYKSKVDTRWVLMQMDPYTRQVMRQDLTPEQGESVMQKLQSPF